MTWPMATVISAALLGAAIVAASANTADGPVREPVRDAVADAGRQQGHPIGNYALSWHASNGALRLCWADLSGETFRTPECTDWVR